jgi:hypothetical protein
MNTNRTSIENLIGLEFKRNKYGLSLWTDEITYVGHRYRIIDRNTRKIEIFVVGGRNDTSYDLDEIVIVNKPLNWIEEASIQKGEIFDSKRSEENLKYLRDKKNENGLHKGDKEI